MRRSSGRLRLQAIPFLPWACDDFMKIRSCDGGYQSVSAYEGRMILGCTLGGAVALTIGSTIGIYGGFWTKAGTRTVQACRNLCIREGYEQLDDKATEHTQNM